MSLGGFLPLQYYASNNTEDVVGRLSADAEVVGFRPAKFGGSAAALTGRVPTHVGKLAKRRRFRMLLVALRYTGNSSRVTNPLRVKTESATHHVHFQWSSKVVSPLQKNVNVLQR